MVCMPEMDGQTAENLGLRWWLSEAGEPVASRYKVQHVEQPMKVGVDSPLKLSHMMYIIIGDYVYLKRHTGMKALGRSSLGRIQPP
jgi:hypothetical protein